jgi:glycosyltransferase involved in cell wall biosynthesis
VINKPRIYVVISTFLPYIGGAEIQTLAKCQRLLEKGNKVRVVTFRHQRDWKVREEIKGVPTLRVAGALLGGREKLPRPVQQFLYVLAILVMSWTIWKQRNNFDVLQVCQLNVLTLPLSIVCLLTRKPMTIIVISAGADKSSMDINAEPRLVAGPLDPNQEWLKVDSQGWINGGDLQGLASKGKLGLELTRTFLYRAKAVAIVLSTRTQRYLREHGFTQLEIERIPNGVDIVRFHPAPGRFESAGTNHANSPAGTASSCPSEQEKNLCVICVSKLRHEKGLDVLLQAWHLVQKQRSDARLIIVGDGPSEAQLKRLASELNILESIEFAGLQSNVPAQLHRANIGILPSRWEGMPNALLEYMASGLASIATRVSGSEDLIQPGVNGLLVESENYVEMAQALLTLLGNAELVQKYGAAARQTIEQSYTIEYVTNRYLEVYQRLIAQSHTTIDKSVDMIKQVPTA